MSFKSVQQAFVDYIREPDAPLPVGTDSRRMQIYRELFFNNIEGFVANAFPVLKSLYTVENWEKLVRSFFAKHHCRTPIFAEIAAEFVDFLQYEYVDLDSEPPFILELAHYELLELQVAVAQDDASYKTLEIIGADDILTLSPCAQVAQYQYEVQHISPEYRPNEPAATPQSFCVYRDRQDEIQFMSLAPLAAQVLAVIAHNEMTLAQVINWAISLYPQMDPESIEQGALSLMTQMAQEGVIRKIDA